MRFYKIILRRRTPSTAEILKAWGDRNTRGNDGILLAWFFTLLVIVLFDWLDANLAIKLLWVAIQAPWFITRYSLSLLCVMAWESWQDNLAFHPFPVRLLKSKSRCFPVENIIQQAWFYRFSNLYETYNRDFHRLDPAWAAQWGDWKAVLSALDLTAYSIQGYWQFTFGLSCQELCERLWLSLRMVKILQDVLFNVIILGRIVRLSIVSLTGIYLSYSIQIYQNKL